MFEVTISYTSRNHDKTLHNTINKYLKYIPTLLLYKRQLEVNYGAKNYDYLVNIISYKSVTTTLRQDINETDNSNKVYQNRMKERQKTHLTQ